MLFFQQPFHCEIEHKLGLTCMMNGPVNCRVRLDRGGYVPGEAISIWATITNNSRVVIKHTRASLTEVGMLLTTNWAWWRRHMTWILFLQTIQYVTRSKVMDTETRELSSVSRGKIRPQETDDWKNEKLFVPPLPPTNLRGCHLIRIQYDVFVSQEQFTYNTRRTSLAFVSTICWLSAGFAIGQDEFLLKAYLLNREEI